jgi:hypothetical protein
VIYVEKGVARYVKGKDEELTVKVSGGEGYGRPCPALHARANGDGARFSLLSVQTETT